MEIRDTVDGEVRFVTQACLAGPELELDSGTGRCKRRKQGGGSRDSDTEAEGLAKSSFRITTIPT